MKNYTKIILPTLLLGQTISLKCAYLDEDARAKFASRRSDLEDSIIKESQEAAKTDDLETFKDIVDHRFEDEYPQLLANLVKEPANDLNIQKLEYLNGEIKKAESKLDLNTKDSISKTLENIENKPAFSNLQSTKDLKAQLKPVITTPITSKPNSTIEPIKSSTINIQKNIISKPDEIPTPPPAPQVAKRETRPLPEIPTNNNANPQPKTTNNTEDSEKLKPTNLDTNKNDSDTLNTDTTTPNINIDTQINHFKLFTARNLALTSATITLTYLTAKFTGADKTLVRFYKRTNSSATRLKKNISSRIFHSKS